MLAIKYFMRALAICFLFLLIISCSSREKESYYESPLIEKDISLEKVDEFVIHEKTESDYTIGELRFRFATNSLGDKHAFYDEQNTQFIITDSKGEIRQVISKEGRGPEEILHAVGFDFNDQNQLVVYDNIQQMIKVFESEGDIISTYRLKDNGFFIGGDLVVSEEKILVWVFDKSLYDESMEQVYKSDLAGIYDYKGNLIDTVGRYDSTVSEIKHYNFNPTINADLKKNKLFSTHSYNFRIQIFDLESGERLAWFGRNTDNFRLLEEEISGDLSMEEVKKRSIGVSTPMMVYSLSDYIGLYFLTTTEEFYETESYNANDTYLALYDRNNYQSYGDIELPYALGNVSGDRLYLIEDDHPDNFTIGVYELAEEN